MSKQDTRPEARLPKGLFDVPAGEIRASREMLDTIRGVFESYGFEPLDTPAIEYTDALGKFLPDQDRPNEGVFSFKDDDEQWLSLRYDLTAPLARYVAENFQNLPKPFRRYQVGPVWRNEKPGPGRFRQFTQFDADTVGASSVAADAELCMLAADTLEALGIPRGQYVIKVNNRKVLDGVLESIDLGGDANFGKRLTVLRAIDKYDRLGEGGVRALLGKGRKDESGDYTKGAGLDAAQIERVISSTCPISGDNKFVVSRLTQLSDTHIGKAGSTELDSINLLIESAGFQRVSALVAHENLWNTVEIADAQGKCQEQKANQGEQFPRLYFFSSRGCFTTRPRRDQRACDGHNPQWASQVCSDGRNGRGITPLCCQQCSQPGQSQI